MKKKPIHMSDLHFEHENWKSELAFQKQELSFFKNRLEEVVPRYTDKSVLAEAERLQNQILIHQNITDELLHDVNSEEHNLSTFAKNHPVASDHVHFKDHTALRDRITTQRAIFNSFKQEFFRYLTETM